MRFFNQPKRILLDLFALTYCFLYPLYGRVGAGTAISPGVRVYHPRRLFMGEECSIRMGCEFVANNEGSKIQLGNRVRLESHVVLMTYGGLIEIGSNSTINQFCTLYGHGGLSIGSNVMIATGVTLVASSHRYDDASRPMREQGLRSLGIRIDDDVWIGAGARVLDGVTIGRGSIVGAGAVVNRTTQPMSIVAGVPARVIGHRSTEMPAKEIEDDRHHPST